MAGREKDGPQVTVEVILERVTSQCSTMLDFEASA